MLSTQKSDGNLRTGPRPVRKKFLWILSNRLILLRGCWSCPKKLQVRKNFDENFNAVEGVRGWGTPNESLRTQRRTPLQIMAVFPSLSFYLSFLSFFLSCVANTQLNHWTKRVLSTRLTRHVWPGSGADLVLRPTLLVGETVHNVRGLANLIINKSHGLWIQWDNPVSVFNSWVQIFLWVILSTSLESQG